ncbi:hypothetical protein PF005_g23127 [Phytophthora fragariae]|uniref:Uncharacterized protein n=1 Tax=Phytophthora fragariae TaxID=53985 RepID=A0A6A3W8E1_9STRA|nr:hypothetical protein PF003_g3442 [Phytophthora fragariae]KAE8938353.1 hypothetical protein PF009_g11760 [Phytophthora fragariae]KAE8983200.1 hypothetical protein PF011_g21291 [Phytophthora fragariae]KAE9082574.1 hypothetical protein PF010_g21534 [Phytophthora fragariae]KAE9111697.1 hypothetical protein PF007_g11384 [Phytophthora fragariae]
MRLRSSGISLVTISSTGMAVNTSITPLDMTLATVSTGMRKSTFLRRNDTSSGRSTPPKAHSGTTTHAPR